MHKGQDFAPRLPNPGVESIRFALPWFKQVAEATGVPTAELLHHLARLIARIVVHHHNFPLHRVREPRSCDAIQRLCQVPATIIRTQDDGNVHRSPTLWPPFLVRGDRIPRFPPPSSTLTPCRKVSVAVSKSAPVAGLFPQSPMFRFSGFPTFGLLRRAVCSESLAGPYSTSTRP